MRQQRVAVTLQALRRGAAARRCFLRRKAAAITLQVLLAVASSITSSWYPHYREKSAQCELLA